MYIPEVYMCRYRYRNRYGYLDIGSYLGRLTGRESEKERERIMTKMTGFVVAQYCSWSLAVKSLGMSCLLIVCLFVFCQADTLQVQVHVHTGIQISVYFCITVLTFFSFFFFSFWFSLPLFRVCFASLFFR